MTMGLGYLAIAATEEATMSLPNWLWISALMFKPVLMPGPTTMIILFNFGTGPIRGFATTLIIGILVSFFTAVFMTRLVYEHFMSKDKWMGLTFKTKISKNLMTNTRFDFMGTNKKSLITVSYTHLITESKYPTIIACGDFNDGSISYTHRILTQKLEDVYKRQMYRSRKRWIPWKLL